MASNTSFESVSSRSALRQCYTSHVPRQLGRVVARLVGQLLLFGARGVIVEELGKQGTYLAVALFNEFVYLGEVARELSNRV